MKKEEVFNQGVLSNLSNLSDSQNASQGADNQHEVVNTDGYLTCHIDTNRLPLMLQKILTISDNNSVRDMLFLSSITALSYACPKFWTLHGKPSKRYNEYIEIDNPQLSVLVSGTYNQLLPLIRSRENGLASRFACYVVKDIQKFDTNVFDEESLSAGSEAIRVSQGHYKKGA